MTRMLIKAAQPRPNAARKAVGLSTVGGAFYLRCARDFNVGLLCKNLIHHPFCFATVDE